MPSFRRSGRNTTGTKAPANEPETSCPFLARTIAATKTHICLSGEEPIAISRRYVDSYCVTANYARCSLFLAAYRASPEVRSPDMAVATLHVDTLADETAFATLDPLPPAQYTTMMTSSAVVETEGSRASETTVNNRDPVSETPATETTPPAKDEVENAPAVLQKGFPVSEEENEPTFTPAEPEHTLSMSDRVQVTADAETLAGLTQALQSQITMRDAALTALTEQIQTIESPVMGVGAPGDIMERIRSEPDDVTLAAAAAAVQEVLDNPNSLLAYIRVARNVPVLLEIVATLLECRTTNIVSDATGAASQPTR